MIAITVISVVALVLAYIWIFSMAKASSDLHRMEEKWEAEKEKKEKSN